MKTSQSEAGCREGRGQFQERARSAHSVTQCNSEGGRWEPEAVVIRHGECWVTKEGVTLNIGEPPAPAWALELACLAKGIPFLDLDEERAGEGDGRVTLAEYLRAMGERERGQQGKCELCGMHPWEQTEDVACEMCGRGMEDPDGKPICYMSGAQSVPAVQN